MSFRPTQKVVVHERDGNVLKGATSDFLAKRRVLHLRIASPTRHVRKIDTRTLKAVFFVKSFQGNKHYQEIKTFPDDPPPGKKVKATFMDGEVIYGYTHAVSHNQSGFFLIPADPNSNNERIFVVFDALTDLVVDGVKTPVPE